MPHFRFAMILAMTVALAPFSVDTYLPSFPHIAQSLHVDINAVALSLSVYVFSLAVSQLLGGPLSDHWGRATILLSGLVVFAIASVLLAFSSNLTELLLFRALQGLGGGWAMVSVPAIVRDNTEGHESAKLFGLIGLMMIVAPAIAPMIGTLILMFSNWPGIFIFLAAYALLVMVLAKLFVLSKSKPRRNIPATKINFIAQYRHILRVNVAIYFLLLQAFAFSIMLVFLTHASFIYQQYFHVSNVTFSILFMCNIVTMACMNRLSRLLLKWFTPLVILLNAVALQALAVALLICITLLHPTIDFFVPALMLTVGSLGAITPNIQACYLQFYPKNSGAAAALLGAMQLGLGGCISAFSAWVANDVSLLPIVLTMGGAAILSVLSGWRIKKLLAKNSNANTCPIAEHR